MSDILIRNVRPELKRQLQESASANKRSLSREIEALLQRALASTTGAEDGDSAGGLGTELSKLVPSKYRLDDFPPPRDNTERPPPDFE